jgi:hypothetical protein
VIPILFFDIYRFRWFSIYLLAKKNFKQSIRVLKTSILNMLFDLFHELVLFMSVLICCFVNHKELKFFIKTCAKYFRLVRTDK